MRLELVADVSAGAVCSFQFHKGAIRTLYAIAKKRANDYFNSIKVRLELDSYLSQAAFDSISIP